MQTIQRKHLAGLWPAIFAIAMTATAFAGDPYVPTDDNEVLETLPRTIFLGRDELASLRQQLSADPGNADVAGALASRYMQAGNEQGDPRFYGYARAAIGRWWDKADAPPNILKLRAKLKEKDHLYDEAILDLRLLLKQEPKDVQAWIEVSNIYRVQGKYAEARAACESLSAFAAPAEATLCRAPLEAVTGRAVNAYAELTSLMDFARSNWPGAIQFILTQQANIAWSLGDDDRAEQHFREGLTREPADGYMLRAYADFLLDRDRNEESLSLLREHTRDTGILLAATIAARRVGNDSLADDWQKELEIRFDEIRLRGGEPHGRFEARYMLELKNDPKRALTLALANWEKQKESRDSRNVLEAALAADDPAAAEPVLNFLNENGTEDVVLQRLARQLAGE